MAGAVHLRESLSLEVFQVARLDEMAKAMSTERKGRRPRTEPKRWGKREEPEETEKEIERKEEPGGWMGLAAGQSLRATERPSKRKMTDWGP